MLVSDIIYGPLQFKDIHNAPFTSIPGLQARLALHPAGSIFYQVLASIRCSMYYFYIDLKETATLSFQPVSSSLLKTKICLSDKLDIRLQKNKFTLLKDQFIIYNGSSKNYEINFHTNGVYRFLFIAYNSRSLKELAHISLGTKQVIEHTSFLLKQSMLQGFAPPPLSRIIAELFIPNHSLPYQFPFLETKLSEYLIELLYTLSKQEELSNHPDPIEEACRKAYQIILQDISRHYTISQLARQLNINEYYLKNGFKNIYGMGIYDFLQMQRMNHARSLILTTDKPLKEISKLVGFDFTTNFITAFNAHFGYTPGSLRR